MPLLNLDAFRRTPLNTNPFEYCVVREFVNLDATQRIEADFPRIGNSGSFSVSALEYGPVFEQLLDELRSDEVRAAFAEKFGIDLTGRPTTLTVRGQSGQRDGRIHIDSKTKLITVLLYLNRDWNAPGGNLRLLRSPDDIEDAIEEVAPEIGTLVAFRCRENAWHGHKPHVGERRSIQLNWVVSDAAVRRSQFVHGVSSFLKRLRKAS
jgi:hypothetical protein